MAARSIHEARQCKRRIATPEYKGKKRAAVVGMFAACKANDKPAERTPHRSMLSPDNK